MGNTVSAKAGLDYNLGKGFRYLLFIIEEIRKQKQADEKKPFSQIVKETLEKLAAS